MGCTLHKAAAGVFCKQRNALRGRLSDCSIWHRVPPRAHLPLPPLPPVAVKMSPAAALQRRRRRRQASSVVGAVGLRDFVMSNRQSVQVLWGGPFESCVCPVCVVMMSPSAAVADRYLFRFLKTKVNTKRP